MNTEGPPRRRLFFLCLKKAVTFVLADELGFS
jgi:DNA-binding NarL/FixJ family response regulator